MVIEKEGKVKDLCHLNGSYCLQHKAVLMNNLAANYAPYNRLNLCTTAEFPEPASRDYHY